MIVVPLLEFNPDTREPLDYAAFSRALEERVRSLETPGVRIHIVGFAKLVGDLIDGLWQVMAFFGISVTIAAVFVFLFTRDLRSTLLLVFVSLLGVVWLLGLMQLLGYVLNPYSILVPFLVFAIGLSHGAQKMNGIMQDVGRGTHKYVAARYTFRRLFMAGLTALLTNVVGFAVLMVIDVPVIRDLALTTSIGVSVLIFTKLMLIPVLLSYIGVSQTAAKRSLRNESEEQVRPGLLWRARTADSRLGRYRPLRQADPWRPWADSRFSSRWAPGRSGGCTAPATPISAMSSRSGSSTRRLRATPPPARPSSPMPPGQAPSRIPTRLPCSTWSS
jgi:uncharacterized membrane protein YdfJ with MMPL/SSD domain